MRRSRRFAPRLDRLELRLSLSGIDPTDPVDFPDHDGPDNGSIHIIAPTPPPPADAPVIA